MGRHARLLAGVAARCDRRCHGRATPDRRIGRGAVSDMSLSVLRRAPGVLGNGLLVGPLPYGLSDVWRRSASVERGGRDGVRGMSRTDVGLQVLVAPWREAARY